MALPPLTNDSITPVYVQPAPAPLPILSEQETRMPSGYTPSPYGAIPVRASSGTPMANYTTLNDTTSEAVSSGWIALIVVGAIVLYFMFD